MNQDSLKSLDRLLNKMERSQKRPRGGISTAPAVLAVGLVVGYLILTRLVPSAWDSLLPHGLEQARTFRGWPGLVYRSAAYCHAYPSRVWVAIGAVVVASLFVSFCVRPLRFLVWLSAVGVIVANAGILYVTLQTSMRATLDGAGF